MTAFCLATVVLALNCHIATSIFHFHWLSDFLNLQPPFAALFCLLVIMVKFRGIEISIISQFDIRKLPEFRFRQTSPSPDRSKNAPHSPQATASCYVPIYPGSQIWFEYAIDGPHPPKAAYFFKLLFNGKVITSFDCGSKHHYYGKMMYNLVVQGTHPITGVAQVVRQALHFTNHNEDCDNEDEDVIEFRVHRIEHRQRIQELTEVGPTSNINKEGKLQ